MELYNAMNCGQGDFSRTDVKGRFKHKKQITSKGFIQRNFAHNSDKIRAETQIWKYSLFPCRC
jgi:hypothetical protein